MAPPILRPFTNDAEAAEALASRTLELCTIPSVIKDEGKLADHVQEWARDWFRPEEIARVGHTLMLGRPIAEQGDSRRIVALFGHLDTVPAHPGDTAPTRDATHVHGLGASDMKGGVATMMLLAERLDRVRSPYHVVFVLYEREEGPYLESGLGPLFDAHPELSAIDLAFCLEPSDNAVQLGCCGSLHAMLDFRGKSAHSARPWQGENAIHKAAPVLQKLAARATNELFIGGLPFKEVMNATLATGGRARNVIPESFSLNVNYRFAPGKAVDAAKAELLALVDGAAHVTFTDEAPSGPVVSDHPVLQSFVKLTGARIEPKQAWTDVGRLATFGIAAVNFGPGESAQAHQANERARIDHLVEGWKMWERFFTAPSVG